MRFRVLGHSLAPAFIWVLVAFTCGTTVGEVALQRVQVIEAEHPVVVDANGTVVGLLLSVRPRDYLHVDGYPNTLVRLASHTPIALYAGRDELVGSETTIWFGQNNCSGQAFLRSGDCCDSFPLVGSTFKLRNSSTVFVADDTSSYPDTLEVNSFLTEDGTCTSGWGRVGNLIPASELTIPLPDFTPPFSAVMRSDLQPPPQP